MRTGYFYSLVFALLTSTSIAVVAAPAVKQEAGNPPVVMEASEKEQSGKINRMRSINPTYRMAVV